MQDNKSAWLNFASLPREHGGLGLAPHQAAGLVGNLVKESGPSLPSWGPTGDNGTAHGTAQWRNERFQGLQNFAQSKGLDYRSMEAQQAFMRHELDGPENRAYRAITAASSPEEAASAFNKLYERSADNTGGREKAARELMQSFGGSAPEAQRGNAMAFSPMGGGTPPPDNGFLGQLGLRSDFMTGDNGGYGLSRRLGRAGAALMAIDNPRGAAVINEGIAEDDMLPIRQLMMAQKMQTQQPVGSDFKLDDKTGTFYRTKADGSLEFQKNPNAVEAAQVNPNLVQAIIEGRAPYPANSRASDAAAIREAVHAQDPSFDAVNYNSRLKTRQDATSGKTAQNLTSFNTTIGHLGTFDKTIDELHNSGSPVWNTIANAVSGQTDTKFAAAKANFETAKTAVIDEMTRAFRGTGGNVHDLEQWEKNISSAASPQALHAAVRQAAELLKSRIDSVGDTYNRGMGTTKDPLELLTPKATESFNRLLSGGGSDKPTHGASDVEAEMRRRGLLK